MRLAALLWLLLFPLGSWICSVHGTEEAGEFPSSCTAASETATECGKPSPTTATVVLRNDEAHFEQITRVTCADLSPAPSHKAQGSIPESREVRVLVRKPPVSTGHEVEEDRNLRVEPASCSLLTADMRELQPLTTFWRSVRDHVVPSSAVLQRLDATTYSIVLRSLAGGSAFDPFFSEVLSDADSVVIHCSTARGSAASQSTRPLSLMIRVDRNQLVETVLVDSSIRFLSSVASPMNVDINERDINSNGLHLSVMLTGGSLRMDRAALSDACWLRFLRCSLESSRRGRRFTVGSVESQECLADSSSDNDDNHHNVTSHTVDCVSSIASVAVSTAEYIVRGLECHPLPCLHENPFFTIKHLVPLGREGLTVAAMQQSWPGEHASVAQRIAKADDGASTRTAMDMVEQWRRATPNLPLVAKAADVTFHGTSWFSISVSFDEIRRRGFQLPNPAHVAWWLAQSKGAVTHDEVDNGRRAVRVWCWHPQPLHGVTFDMRWDDACPDDALEGASHRFVLTVGEGAGVPKEWLTGDTLPVDAAHRLAPLHRATLQSLAHNTLSPRGASPFSTYPYPSLTYDVTHPQLDTQSAGWVGMNGRDAVRLTASCVLGHNHTPACPLQFGVVARHYTAGFDVIGEDSALERRLKSETVFLGCPPSLLSPSSSDGDDACATRYYGDAAVTSLQMYFRSHWIREVKVDRAYRRIVRFHLNAVPPELLSTVSLEATPIHLFIRLPSGLTGDDGMYPRPAADLEGNRGGAAKAVYRFVITADDEPNDETLRDEL